MKNKQEEIIVTDEEWEEMKKFDNPVFVNLYAPELMEARAKRKMKKSNSL